MSYPFAPFQTFGDIRQQLASEFGCRFQTQTLERADGEKADATLIQRMVDGSPRSAVVVLPDDRCVTPTQLRSICARLGIPLEAFGIEYLADNEKLEP